MVSKISIIIPTFNEEECIEATLKAALEQKTDFEFDVLVSDGKSTDNTVKLAGKSAKVLNSPKRGKVAQLNFAAKQAKGDILIFVDADTVLPQNYLQHIYDLHENDKNLWASGAQFKYWKEGEGKQRFQITMANLLIPRYFGISNLFGYTKIPGCNFAVRKDMFFKVGGFIDIPNEDSALCTSLKQLAKEKGYGRIYYFKNPTVLCSPRRVLETGVLGLIQYYRKKEKKRFKEQK